MSEQSHVYYSYLFNEIIQEINQSFRDFLNSHDSLSLTSQQRLEIHNVLLKSMFDRLRMLSEKLHAEFLMPSEEK